MGVLLIIVIAVIVAAVILIIIITQTDFISNAAHFLASLLSIELP